MQIVGFDFRHRVIRTLHKIKERKDTAHLRVEGGLVPSLVGNQAVHLQPLLRI
eukprot:SAG11_NODE_1642_length_4529_cov_2.274944_4_plen_53_part_00